MMAAGRGSAAEGGGGSLSSSGDGDYKNLDDDSNIDSQMERMNKVQEFGVDELRVGTGGPGYEAAETLTRKE